MKSIIQYANEFIKETPNIGDTSPSFAVRQFAILANTDGYQKGGRIQIPLAYKKSPVNARITCEGLVYGMSGFAEAMRNVIYTLDKNKVNVNVEPLDKKFSDNVDVTTTKKGQVIDELSRISYEGDSKKIRISMTVPEGIRKSRFHDYQIAYIMFETKDFPKRYITHLNQAADEIWTPSTFNVENIKRAGWKKPIYWMPLGVDTDRFNPNTVKPFTFLESPIAYFNNHFIFLSIMGWSERKGISVLLEAYLKEFTNNQRTMLYIKGGWYDKDKALKEVQEAIQKFNRKNTPLIYLDFNIYRDEDLPRLYANADAFVLPSRGEGWGLNYTEAMSMGLPTIGTNATSMKDFMTDINSFPIKVNGNRVEPRCDWITPDYKGAKFAVPSVKNLQEQMFKARRQGSVKGEQARRDMVSLWNWQIACGKWIERLRELQ